MQLDLMQGTLDMLILKALSQGPAHGYGIARWIQARTDDALSVEEGSLYPALQRMWKRGWVKAEWGLSENNRRAKFYTLTPVGRLQLAQEALRWSHFTDAVAKVMSARPAQEGA